MALKIKSLKKREEVGRTTPPATPVQKAPVATKANGHGRSLPPPAPGSPYVDFWSWATEGGLPIHGDEDVALDYYGGLKP